jgi:type I restriction enzyme S subunit
MKTVRIEKAFEFVRNGLSVKQEDGKTGIPITRIETIWNSNIDKDRFGYADITEEKLKDIERYLLNEGDILMTHINSPKHLGKCAIYNNKPKKLIHGMNLLCLRPNAEILFPKYAMYFFSSSPFRSIIPRISNQSVNQASFSAGNLKDIQIPLPPLATQKKIAAILDAADAYRQKTKTLIDKYDQLAQSLFLYMFGDPVRNEKGWFMERLDNLTSKIGSGATPSGGRESYQNEGVSLIRSMNVYDNGFKYKDLAFLNEDQAEKLKNVTVEENDVLFNITGASVCRCCIVPPGILPARVNQHVSILRPKNETLTPIFLSRLLVSENCKKQLLGIGTQGGATREAITKEQLEKFEIILPPIVLQIRFAERIQLIEAQKQQAQASLQKAEDLFNSLLQRAFSVTKQGRSEGELVS